MNPIANALTQGFSHQNILQYLLRHFPHARKQIESALAKGFTADKIVDFLQGGRKEVNKSVTEHEKTRQSDKEKQRNLEKGIVKGGLALGATALGGYALSRALPRAGSALAGQLLPALPNSPVGPGNQLPGPQQTINVTPQGGPTPQVPPLTGPQSTQGQQNVQQSPPLTMPTPRAEQSQATIKSPPLPQALQDHALTMLRAGNPIDKVAGALKSLQPKIVKDYEKATGQSIDRAVQDFASSYLPPKQRGTDSPISSPIMEKGLQPQEQKIEQTIESIPEEVKEIRKKEKGSTVALPNGDIGEITNIRQGIATVNANGKEFRRKVEELIEPPMPQKDLADLHDELIKGIEAKTGEEVSRMVNWAGYDPKTNELAFVPHVGALYVYDNISPEDAAELTSILSTRKSTGENFIGAWKQGSKSPIGAAMYRLIEKLQKERGGKGSEYKGKYEKIYDAFELPKIESKARQAERKKSEKPSREKIPESKILEERFDKISKKLQDLKNKPEAKNVRLQTERIKNIENLEKQYTDAWNQLREQLIHEKEMKEINEDIRKEKRKAKKPGTS